MAEGGQAGHEDGVRSYLEAFAPVVDWDDLVRWPPDVFALANLALDHTKSYRFAIAPPAGRFWPPFPEWNEEVSAAAQAWRTVSGGDGGALPPLVRRSWESVTGLRDLPLAEIRSGAAWKLICALHTLHAAADEACAHLGSGAAAAAGSFEQRAWDLFRAHSSLARLSPRRMRVVPKTNFSPRGITIRSLSRYLGLSYELVPVQWTSGAPEGHARSQYNVLLLPWPLRVQAEDFRALPSTRLRNMDTERFGFFEFAPPATLDCGLVGSLLAEAAAAGSDVDAVVLPEAALLPEEIPALEETLARHAVRYVISGVRQSQAYPVPGRNYLHLGMRTATGWERVEQSKHHRWSLDGPQIRQYHLSRTLDPQKLWWEAIDIGERTLGVAAVAPGVTVAPLVCEDLASLDECAHLLRDMGPSLIVAVLLDGPQLTARWPCRYSGVLADDPGSAVLTLTSYGMAARCRPSGKRRSRVVAHWNSRTDRPHELSLGRGSAGVLLTLRVEPSTVWTADGRLHPNSPSMRLSSVQQLAGRRTRAPA
ncbi:MAG TPA: hypothetical protein VFJ11_00530 [Gaiellaceae bacterium]|nr:hypothetical protein [Gaiellaceae bacterium]